jgi:anti-sigma regulatory factor (Ser/Thr protein kinase)
MPIAPSAHTDVDRPPVSPNGAAVMDSPALTRQIDLTARPEAAGQARRFAHSCLVDWHLDAMTDDIDLVVSELVTNALLHARTEGRPAGPAPIRLEVLLNLDSLVCRVTDSSAALPAQEAVGESAENGRGLFLVDVLSTQWGWFSGPVGKVVWASFDL